MNMEPDVVCKDCGEKTSTNFSFCQKCGTNLPPMLDQPNIYSIRRSKSVREYKISEMNEQESSETPLISITGEWLLLSKLLFLSLILAVISILWGISSIAYKEPESRSIITEILRIGLKEIPSPNLIWIGVTIAFVIITIFVLVLKDDVSIFTVQDLDGSPMGEMRSNWTRSKWKILGLSEENQARIKLRSYSYIRKGEIKTPVGTFKAIALVKDVNHGDDTGYYVATKCNITDSNGNLCLIVTWVDPTRLSLSSEYRIEADAQGIMSHFLTITVSMCLIDKFLSSIKYYQPDDGGCGCD